jgi:glutamine cyclotransferase
MVATAMSCQSASATQDYTVVSRFPHDTTAYTQGLVHSDGVLYESTGRLGYSQVRRIDLATGNVLMARDLPANRFGAFSMRRPLRCCAKWQCGTEAYRSHRSMSSNM